MNSIGYTNDYYGDDECSVYSGSINSMDINQCDLEIIPKNYLDVAQTNDEDPFINSLHDNDDNYLSSISESNPSTHTKKHDGMSYHIISSQVLNFGHSEVGTNSFVLQYYL